MKLTLFACLFSLASAAVIGARDEDVINYDGFKVYRITTGENLASVQEQLSGLDLLTWNIDLSQHMDIAISPDQVSNFEALNLEATVMHDDLGADIAAEYSPQTSSTGNNAWVLRRRLLMSTGLMKRALPSSSWFNSYHSYNDHVQFVRDLQSAFTSNSEVITSGTSVQGRAITGLHLWGKGGKGSKPAIIFHGTVHAREWITTMVVEYLTYQIVTGYGKDSAATSMLDSYDFYILPIVNPDGFSYTQTNDRLWRKNRSAAPSGSSCLGTDINRNWPYQW